MYSLVCIPAQSLPIRSHQSHHPLGDILKGNAQKTCNGKSQFLPGYFANYFRCLLWKGINFYLSKLLQSDTVWNKVTRYLNNLLSNNVSFSG